MSGEKLANETGSDTIMGGEEGARAEPSLDVGGRLRSAREERHLSIEDAAFALKLSPRQVVEIEANEWTGLPTSVVRGFVRNYARYLGLDAAQLLDGLEHMPLPERPELRVDVGTPVSMPREGRADRRDYFRIFSGLIILLLALAAYLLLPPETWRSVVERIKAVVVTDSTPAPAEADSPAGDVPVEAAPVTTPAAPTPPAEPAPVPVPVSPAPLSFEANPPATSPVPVAASVLAPRPVEKPAVPAEGEALYFSFAQPSWVEVRDRSGEIVYSQLNQAGTQREISGQPPYSLVIGNASQVTLQFRGKPVDLMAIRSKGDVARLTLE
jgi:cytoskeleton protein RodZ